MDSSNLFNDFSPLRLYLRDISTSDERAKKYQIFLIKRIFDILSAIMRETNLLTNPTIVKNLEKTIIVLDKFSKFQSCLKNELTDEQKSVFVDFAIMNVTDIGETANDVQKCQLPLLSALLEEQNEIFAENITKLDAKQISSLYSSVSSWLAEKQQDWKGKILELLPKSNLNSKLLNEGLTKLSAIENAEDFRRQIEFLVEISNNCNVEGHRKIISCVKDILLATESLGNKNVYFICH